MDFTGIAKKFDWRITVINLTIMLQPIPQKKNGLYTTCVLKQTQVRTSLQLLRPYPAHPLPILTIQSPRTFGT
jgi:hypothetical protein